MICGYAGESFQIRKREEMLIFIGQASWPTLFFSSDASDKQFEAPLSSISCYPPSFAAAAALHFQKGFLPSS